MQQQQGNNNKYSKEHPYFYFCSHFMEIYGSKELEKRINIRITIASAKAMVGSQGQNFISINPIFHGSSIIELERLGYDLKGLCEKLQEKYNLEDGYLNHSNIYRFCFTHQKEDNDIALNAIMETLLQEMYDILDNASEEGGDDDICDYAPDYAEGILQILKFLDSPNFGEAQDYYDNWMEENQ